MQPNGSFDDADVQIIAECDVMIQVIDVNERSVVCMEYRSFGHATKQLEDLRSLDVLLSFEEVPCRGILTRILETCENLVDL